MVNTKKVITLRDNVAVVAELRDAGFDKISLFFAPHPRHKAMGLLPEQMLVTAWRFRSRVDRKNRKVGE
jgi:hypothetical protein